MVSTCLAVWLTENSRMRWKVKEVSVAGKEETVEKQREG